MKKNILLAVLLLTLNLPFAFTAAQVDDDPSGGNQVEQLMKRKQQAQDDMKKKAEAQKKAGCRIIESSRDTLIGSWHSDKNPSSASGSTRPARPKASSSPTR